MRREFSVSAEDQHIFALSSAPSFRAGHYKDLTETGNRARKVSGTQDKLGYNVEPLSHVRYSVPYGNLKNKKIMRLLQSKRRSAIAPQ